MWGDLRMYYYWLIRVGYRVRLSSCKIENYLDLY